MKRAIASLAFLISFAAVPAHAVDLRGLDAPPEPPVTAEQLAPYAKSGSASVSGRVFAQLPGTAFLYYRNATVRLMPAIPYANWLVDDGLRENTGAFRLGTGDRSPQIFTSAIRITQTGDDGRFRFTNLPALPYLVFVYATESETRSAFGTTPKYVQNMEYMGNVLGFQPVTTTIEVPYSYAYTCHASGWLFGAVTAVASSDTPASLATMYSTNDGC